MWAKHAVLADNALVMDVDVEYSDQHSAYNPVPVLGGRNAVLWLEGASVSADFDASESWVFDSTITGYAWSAPGASATSGLTTATPTITYNDASRDYRLYCTVTAANGKTTTGVINVFVFDDDHMPATVFQLAQCQAEYETGGWMFDVNMEAEASLSEIRDRSLVVLFAKDWYGIPPNQVKQSIGPIPGRENIVCVGRIVGQSIRWDRESGNVHFVVQGAHYWLNKIKGFPIQIQPASAAASWSQMAAMTIDRVLWHVLYWHSTVIETMDFYPPNDSRFVDQGTSMASSIWGQLVDISFSRILASPGVDRFGRLFIEVDPNATPGADRGFPTIMPLTDDDWQEGIDLQRVTVEDCSLIRLTTQLINSSGTGITLYSLSPGHTPRKYGEPEMLDRLLASSQAQSNSLAGLVLGWRTNEFPDVPVILLQNNRMFDLWPRQFGSLSMAADDNPRGVAYDGNLIPRRVSLYHDSEISYMHPEINFEGETFEQLSANGDIPDTDADDLTLPPIVGLPPLDLPDLPDIVPGGIGDPTPTGPKRVLFHDLHLGLVIATEFDTTPVYNTANAGLTAAQYQNINWMGVCPNGAVYVGGFNLGVNSFLARAPSAGGTFVIMTMPTIAVPITAAINPLVPEQIGFLTRADDDANGIFHVGTYASYNDGASIGWQNSFIASRSLSYGLGVWLLTAYELYVKINAAGTSILGTGTPHITPGQLRASTTGITYHGKNGANAFIKGDNNLATNTEVSTGESIELYPVNSGVGRWAFDCDPTGRVLMGGKKSSDFGATWGTLGGLAPGNYCFCYAGPGESSSHRFIAAAGVVRYTPDFGVTWVTKENASLTGLYPFPLINMSLVLEF